MRKLVYILCAAAALVGLWGCQNKEEPPVKTVDLRYRVNDSYELPATGAQAFTILVASTDPWTVTSEHPDWCIISEEEGAASDPDDVHAGKAVPTTIRVQYYDNTFLDDRVDKITIKSDYWVGKVVTVTQKGSAFLTVPEEDLNQEVEKAGGQFVIHVSSNQDWSSRVTDGDWVSISEGASGTGTGTITVDAADNAAELRYAEVTVFDRHDVAAARILPGAANALPGTVVSLTDGVIAVSCAGGIVGLTEVQPEGKKRMPAAAFINGRRLSVGDRLEKL